MNGEQQPKVQRSFWNTVKQLPGRLWRVLYHNWQWKLLALLLAVCLWAGLISQDSTLSRERIFTDVTISVSGEESLKRNSGLIVISGLEPENLTVRFRANIPQNQYNNATASNYNPRIDLTKITETGEQTVRVLTTSTSTYGSATNITPEAITVVVDKYVTNYRVPVVSNIIGEYPEGVYGSAVSLDPSTVAISGPESVVSQIAKVRVDYDVSAIPAAEGRLRTALPMQFVTKTGEIIESDLLEVTSVDVVLRTIIAEQTLYSKAVLPVKEDGAVSGTPASGYQITGVSVSPSEVTVAANSDVLSQLEGVYLDGSANAEGKEDTFTQTVRLKKPTDAANVSPDAVTVTVTIEPIDSSRVFNNLKINAIGLSAGRSVSLGKKNASVVLYGKEPALAQLASSDLTVVCDVTGLEPGTYELPLTLLADGFAQSDFTCTFTPATVNVTIK